MSPRIDVKATHQLGAPAERVYDAWLQPDMVRAWMSAALKEFGLTGEMRRVEIDPRVGGSYHFSDMRDGAEARHWGKYTALDRPGKISFTWVTDEDEEGDPSTVTLVIEPEPAGCTASIIHSMDAKWAEYALRVETGWTRMLQAIDRLLESK